MKNLNHRRQNLFGNKTIKTESKRTEVLSSRDAGMRIFNKTDRLYEQSHRKLIASSDKQLRRKNLLTRSVMSLHRSLLEKKELRRSVYCRQVTSDFHISHNRVLARIFH